MDSKTEYPNTCAQTFSLFQALNGVRCCQSTGQDEEDCLMVVLLQLHQKRYGSPKSIKIFSKMPVQCK